MEKKLTQEISDMQKGRETSEERTELMLKLSNQESKVKDLDTQLARFSEFDPEEMQKLQENTLKAREAANRWVDNIFNCQSWAQKTFSMLKKDFDAQFGIPSDLDYIEKVN